MDRRQFTNFLLAGGALGWLGSVLYPVFSFLKPPKIAEATVNTVKVGPEADFPAWGELAKRGVLWEVQTAMPLIMSGADLVIVYHPESLTALRRNVARISAYAAEMKS